MEICNVDFFFFSNGIMVSLLYMHAKRTSWKIRPRPKTVILKIKFKFKFIPISVSFLLRVEHLFSLSTSSEKVSSKYSFHDKSMKEWEKVSGTATRKDIKTG